MERQNACYVNASHVSEATASTANIWRNAKVVLTKVVRTACNMNVKNVIQRCAGVAHEETLDVLNVANVMVSFVPVALRHVDVLAVKVTAAVMNVFYMTFKMDSWIAQDASKQLPLCWWSSVGDRMKK